MASVENGSNATVAQRGELPEWVSCYLTVDQADKVEEAVAHAEKRTSGEIVPVIVRRCVTFKPPTLQLSAVFVLLYCVYAETRISLWMDTQEKIWLGVGLIFAGALAPLLMRSARIRRLMMPDGDAAQIANLRAEAEFYRSGIGSTKDSTGILLFLAIEERQAVVLADSALTGLTF